MKTLTANFIIEQAKARGAKLRWVVRVEDSPSDFLMADQKVIIGGDTYPGLILNASNLNSDELHLKALNQNHGSIWLLGIQIRR